jgi:hypothetical protein
MSDMSQRDLNSMGAFLAVVVLAANSEFPISGTWEGKTNELPSVELTIKNDSGGISGVIGFYFQTRSEDGKWHVGEKTTLPLLAPKLEGTVLTFETIHRKKHGSPELGPNNKYRVTFVGEKEARLNILKDPATEIDSRSGLKLTLRK